jgi:hypothetical protein
VRTFDWLRALLRREWESGQAVPHKTRLPPVTYPSLAIVQEAPRNNEVLPGSVTVIAPGRRPKWVMFLCPCGCRAVITLPLQRTKRPYWSCHRSSAGRATLHPSIWRDVGCLSHFILEDGRVFWSADNGISPEVARNRQRTLKKEAE